MSTQRPSRTPHLIAAMATLLLPSMALANSPSQHFTQGGQGSGAATDYSVGSLFANPAIITNFSNNQVHADLTGSWRLANYTREVNGEERDTARLLSFDAQPNFAFSRQLSDTGLFVGLTVGRGYLDRSHWLDAENGEQRWQSIYSGLRTWTLSPTASYKINDKFSFGANIQLTRVHMYGYQALDYGPFTTNKFKDDPRTSDINAPPEAPGNEGRAHMDFKGNAGAIGAGVTFAPSPSTRIGLSFVSSSEVNIGGDVSVYRPRNDFHEMNYSDEEEARATLETRLPGKLQLGVMHQLGDKLDVQADLELIQWSALDEVYVDVSADTLGGINSPDRRFDTAFRNVAALRLGMTRHTDAKRSTFLGVGYRSSPVADENLSPAWLYGHTIDATYGMKFPVGKRQSMGVAYTQSVMVPRQVSENDQVQGAAGQYNQFAGFLNVSFDWELVSRSLDLPEVTPAQEGAKNL